jgi:acetyl-CoA C-acetyltransferase
MEELDQKRQHVELDGPAPNPFAARSAMDHNRPRLVMNDDTVTVGQGSMGNSAMRDVCITGIGSTVFGRHRDRSIQALAIEAAEAAIMRAGIERRQIGALYLGNFIAGPLTGQEVLAGIVADRLGLSNIPCTKVEGACASGGIAFRHAVLAVQSGMCDAAIAVGVEKMTQVPREDVTNALLCARDNVEDGDSALTFPGLFGRAWKAYEARYGITREEVAAVSIKNKSNGLKNPLAQLGASVTLDTIRQSPMIADPVQLYDCCPVSDGAAAVVVTTRDLARDAPFEATVCAAQRAYAAAGLTARDLDFVELHDCFSIAEIIDAEDLGIVPRGQGGKWAAEGRTAVGGDIAINPSGGLLSKGHPVGATGVGQIYEAVLQLRGMHGNQVRDAGIGLTHNLGGVGVACTVNILRRPDAR